jgi:hypothetical protein
MSNDATGIEAVLSRIPPTRAGFDDSLLTFRREIGASLDLSDMVHISSMLRWLNRWGCRQFKKDIHELARVSIQRWYEVNASLLPELGTGLLLLPNEAVHATAEAYKALRRAAASRKRLARGHVSDVTCGPTGAAKILFALRPDALPPWDSAIRKALRFDGSRNSYLSFLCKVQRDIQDLVGEANQTGITLEQIPDFVGRPQSSLPKLVDEYHWISFTRSGSSETGDPLNGS